MKFCNYRMLIFVKVVLLSNLFSYAQLSVPFKVRYQAFVKGDMTLIANNSTNRVDYNNNANDPYYNQTSSAKLNDEFDIEYIDIDDDATTFSSSSADLVLDDNSSKKILYAGLYWSATYKYNSGTQKKIGKFVAEDETRSPFNTIKIKVPGSLNYTSVTGQVIYDGINDKETKDFAPYVVYADVTNLVQQATTAFGTYTVANIRATQGMLSGGVASGWTLYFVYEDQNKSGKFITSFDGFASVTDRSTDILFNGFETLPEGNVNAKLACAALEGDSNMIGDQLLFNSTNDPRKFIPLSNPIRKANNFFNSSITIDDNFYSKRRPDSKNTLGYDTSLITIPNLNNEVIGNNIKEATLRLKSSGDRYMLFFAAFNVEITEEKFLQNATYANVISELENKQNQIQLVNNNEDNFEKKSRKNQITNNKVVTDRKTIDKKEILNSVKDNDVALLNNRELEKQPKVSENNNDADLEVFEEQRRNVNKDVKKKAKNLEKKQSENVEASITKIEETSTTVATIEQPKTTENTIAESKKKSKKEKKNSLTEPQVSENVEASITKIEETSTTLATIEQPKTTENTIVESKKKSKKEKKNSLTEPQVLENVEASITKIEETSTTLATIEQPKTTENTILESKNNSKKEKKNSLTEPQVLENVETSITKIEEISTTLATIEQPKTTENTIVESKKKSKKEKKNNLTEPQVSENVEASITKIEETSTTLATIEQPKTIENTIAESKKKAKNLEKQQSENVEASITKIEETSTTLATIEQPKTTENTIAESEKKSKKEKKNSLTEPQVLENIEASITKIEETSTTVATIEQPKTTENIIAESKKKSKKEKKNNLSEPQVLENVETSITKIEETLTTVATIEQPKTTENTIAESKKKSKKEKKNSLKEPQVSENDEASITKIEEATTTVATIEQPKTTENTIAESKKKSKKEKKNNLTEPQVLENVEASINKKEEATTPVATIEQPKTTENIIAESKKKSKKEKKNSLTESQVSENVETSIIKIEETSDEFKTLEILKIPQKIIVEGKKKEKKKNSSLETLLPETVESKISEVEKTSSQTITTNDLKTFETISLENKLTENEIPLEIIDVKVNNLEKGYYIVANVFQKHQNAIRFEKFLNEKGLNAKYFINNQNNYRYVYIDKTNNEEEAINLYKSKVNNTYQERIWILSVNNK